MVGVNFIVSFVLICLALALLGALFVTVGSLLFEGACQGVECS